MKRCAFVFALAATLLLSSSCVRAASGYAPDEVMVKVKSGKSAAFAKTAKAQWLSQKEDLKQIGFRVMKLPKGLTVDDAVRKLAKDPSVEYVGPNHFIHIAAAQVFPDDPVLLYGDDLLGMPQWGLYNDGDNQGWGGKLRADIHAPEAWAITTGSANIKIAIIDTGVDNTHEDLWNKVLTGYNAIDNSTDTTDDNGHGTFTAGIAGADTNNGIGIAGIAWLSPILPVKVIDASGQGTEADGAEGIIWAADHGAKVLSMSFATDINDPALASAITYAWNKGCLPIAATGNENVSTPMYPAAYANVIAVGATNEFDQRCTAADWGSGGSNYGSYIDIMAPGSYITSTYTDAFFGQTYFPNSGTSASAPFVSGVAALVWALHPTWTNQQILDQVIHTADDLVYTNGTEVVPAGWDQYTGWGRLNAYRALTESVSGPVTNIGKLRSSPDGQYAELTAKVITAGTGQVPNMAYVEEPDRSSGIMLYYSGGVPFGYAPGNRVTVKGSITTMNGEKTIVAAALSSKTTGTELRPVGMTNRQALGSAGTMLQGMLVKVWGKVTLAAFDHMYIDDGSGLDDGSGYPGVRIVTAPPSGIVEGTSVISVIGMLGMDKPQGAATPVPVVRPRKPGDIRILK